MLNGIFLRNPVSMLLPWLFHAFGYYLILKKMGLNRKKCVIPFLADHELSKILFRRMRTFWRPFIIALIFIGFAFYLGPEQRLGYVFFTIASFVYWVFLARMYFRIAKCFGKGALYGVLMALFPILFLLILGLGRSQYLGPPALKPVRQYSKPVAALHKIGLIVVSAVEIAVLVVGAGALTLRELPPRLLTESILNDTYAKTNDIEVNNECKTREDTMGEAFASLADMPASREHFFPDHSADRNVVVMTYIIGADLENGLGMASANISMMKDATKKGDGLTFVLQTGGSRRWFTSGIDQESYGRYTIRNGNVEKALELDQTMNMSRPENLEDFIKWTKENYPADRYMLVLWDHGGGINGGYGMDDFNGKDDPDHPTMLVSEIVDVLKAADVKFDVIGFDACLMQELEIASALEPYADYYLASEETEGGFGWYYTSGFSKLAENPGMSSDEFGRDMVSAYDQFNTILKDGKPDTTATLSFVDLAMVKPAAKRVAKIFNKADAALRKDPDDFAEIALAANNAYQFVYGIQIDLIDFLEKLNDIDVDNSICSDAEKKSAIDALKACVVYRNKDSAEGVNGLAFAFSYKYLNGYDATQKELRKLSLTAERSLFNDVFSVMAYQKKEEHDRARKSKESPLAQFLLDMTYTDYTKEEWYVKGFEDYDPSSTIINIPLKDTGNGYQIELPEKTWKIIVDCRTLVYQKAEDGRLRLLGSDQIGDIDENGHPMVDADDKWVHINGHLAYYKALPIKTTESGTVFTGTTRARLNGSDDIIIYIEWSPVTSEDDAEEGYILGYELAKEKENAITEKGLKTFQAGDTIELLFDYYDDQGKLVSTETYGGSIIVSGQDRLKAEDLPLPECDIKFLGVLKDVYQRDMMTETIDAHIGAE